MKAEDFSDDALRAQIEILSKKITPTRFEKLRRAAHLRTRKLTVVLEDVFQPHNGSAVLRSADAFGLQEVHIVENRYRFKVSHQVDMGASKWLDVFRYGAHSDLVNNKKFQNKNPLTPKAQRNATEAFKAIRARGYTLAAAALDESACAIETLPLDKPLAVMIGTELTGLSGVALRMADVKFRVPMLGLAQSFNLSVFAAVCLSGLSARLRSKPRDSWALSPREELELLLGWLKKCVKNSGEILSLD